MIHFTDHLVVPWLGLLAEWSLRWAVTIVCTAGVLRLGRARRTATRYMLCMVTIVVGILLPALPRWGPGFWQTGHTPRSTSEPTGLGMGDREAPAVAPATEQVVFNTTPVSQLSVPTVVAEPTRPATIDPRQEPLGSRRLALLLLAGLWVTGVLVSLVRLVGGFILLERMRRASVPVEEGARRVFEACCSQLQLRRHVRLAAHAALRSPITVGPLHPTILVASDWSELPPDVQCSGLRHELTHVARYDDWQTIGTELIRALFFFHPLVHWLINRLYRERELLCDEAAVANGSDPLEYASMLLDFAHEPGPLGSRLVLNRSQAILLGDRRTVKARIERLLDATMHRWMSPLPRGRAILLGGVFVSLAASFGSLRLHAVGETSETVIRATDDAVAESAPSVNALQLPADKTVNVRPEPRNEVPSASAGPTAVKTSEALGTQNADMPDLPELITAIKRHEESLATFQVKVMATFRPKPDLSPKERREYPWADGRKHQRLYEHARNVTLGNVWLHKERHLLDDRLTVQYSSYSNGERITSVTEFPPGRQIGSTKPSVTMRKPGVDLVRLPGVDPLAGLFPQGRPLAALLAESTDAKVELEASDANVKFSCGPDNRWKFIVWLSRRHSWYPVRFEFGSGAVSDFRTAWKATQLRKSGNAWYPAEGAHEYYDPARTGGKLSYTVDFRVLEFDATRPLPAEAFVYKIPDGTQVRDEETGEEFVQGQGPVPKPEASKEKKDFTVIVRDVRGQPVRGAAVENLPSNYGGDGDDLLIRRESDEMGEAQFQGVPKDILHFRVRHADFRAASWAVGPDMTTLTVRLAPRSRGTVLDDEGQPAQDVQVGYFIRFRDDGVPTPWGLGSRPHHVWTRAAGQFELTNELTLRGNPLQPVFVLAFDESGAKMALRLVPADELDQPQDLKLQPTCLVRAALDMDDVDPKSVSYLPADWTDQDGRTFADQLAELTDMQGRVRATVVGRVPPGSYQLRFRQTEQSEAVTIPFTVKPGAEELDLGIRKLQPAGLAALRGKPAPELATAAWRPGEPKRLADLRGKVVVLDFWGYWCIPCVEQMPGLVAIAEKFREQPVEWIAVHTPDVKDFDELDQKLADIRDRLWKGRPLPFVTVIDSRETDDSERGKTATRYGIQLWPTLVVIDQSGNVVGSVQKDQLAETVRALLTK